MKSALVSIALAYVIACYPAFVASWFVPATTPPDLQALQMTWVDHALHFLIAPVTAPIVIYACTSLSFLWGVRLFPEGLIPLVTFVVIFGTALLFVGRPRAEKVEDNVTTANGHPRWRAADRG